MPTVIEVIDTAITAADAYHREDLVARLRQSRARVLSQEVQVLVVGEFNQGKSYLVNALVGTPVCPVADDISPAVTTTVRFASEPEAFLVTGDSREPIEHVADIRSGTVEVRLPRSVLDGGLTLVDSPGPEPCDAILIVSDSSSEYTDTELDLIKQAQLLAPVVICVLSKMDLYPAWRDVAELNRAKIDPPLVPVSAELRMHAMATGDAQLNEESGFPELLRVLRDALARRSAVYDVLAATDDLISMMTDELESLRSDTFDPRSIRWQQTLNDGITDLIADIDHDLRDRLRDVLRVAEAELDAVDPAKVGDEFAEWLQQKELECTSATFAWMMTRARWLAGHVAEQFGDGRVLPEIREAPELTDAVSEYAQGEPEKFGLGQKLIVGMRGGYGGTLMIGMASTIVGVAMINPLSIGAGLLLGGKTVQEERKRLLQRRQADAKAALRKHVDDVIFQAGKQSRDRLREIQRTLRDHFAAHAEQMHRSMVDAAADRKTRMRDLNAELARVRELARAAREVAA